jgi:hypothetical protein
MKQVLASLLVMFAASAAAERAADVKPAVLARNLVQLQATGKVLTGLWTVRNDSCTLQLVFPNEILLKKRTTPPRANEPLALVPVQVWILANNGAQIPATHVSPANPAGMGGRNYSVDATYIYPRAACLQDVAAAISIGDDYFIEKLEALPDRPQ